MTDNKKKEEASEETPQEPQDKVQPEVVVEPEPIAEPEQPPTKAEEPPVEVIPEEPFPEIPIEIIPEEPVEETPAKPVVEEPPQKPIEAPAEDNAIELPLDEPAAPKEPVEEVKKEPALAPSEQIMMPLEPEEVKSDEEILLGELDTTSEESEPEEEEIGEFNTQIFALRTTANREGQVLDFLSSNASKKGLEVFSVIQPHGMRGYIFVEAATRSDAEQAAFRVPYARGILPNNLAYQDIEHMLEKSKKVEMNIRKNDIAEIISGPFKREKCKISRVDKGKEEVVVELLEAAVPIPITLKMDAIKVIRRETEEGKA